MKKTTLKIRRQTALLALLLTLFSFAASAQEIKGTIILSGSSSVISGAMIEATQVITGVRYVSISDANGRYDLVGLSRGPYNLRVSKSGYRTQTQNVPVKMSAGVVYVANFALVPSGTTKIEINNDRSLSK